MPSSHSPEDTDAAPAEPISSDVDLRQAAGAGARPARLGLGDLAVVAAVSAGGAIGAAARYGIGQEWPTHPGGFPVSTVAINVLGCALIGVLMVLMTDVTSSLRLARPFLGTGVLGGFTTFSTYTVDTQRLAAGDDPGTALLYLALTPLSALLAVWVMATATRRLVHWRIR